METATATDAGTAPLLRAPMPAHRSPDDPLWYRRAILYQLHVRSFYDSNGDGVGDFPGLIKKLDYLQDLGATALWLMPFYPSPLKDDGYDIADYRGVHPGYGTMADFKTFLRQARRAGLRVITELVINHTSDQHRWFQRARRSPPGSRWRNYYVWSDRPDRYPQARVIFKDYESSNWTWDPVAGAYYWHRFYHHQPDLNFDNPEVRTAIRRVVDYWLRMGVDGIGLTAVPYLFEREGTNCENLPETHVFLKDLRRHVDQKFHGRMLMGEANQWPEHAAEYFGAGDQCHTVCHFPLMPRLYMAVQTEDRAPIVDILHQTPSAPEGSQWILFLRNQDELTLEMVTEEERGAMYRYFARNLHARVHLGIRRRLAPLMDNDGPKIELLSALLLTLPGTPVIYYGDEIGMGDNLYLGDRAAVRTPMQWSSDRNGGFSEAGTQDLFLPVISDPNYHYETVNVRNQLDNRLSLLSWLKQALALRRRSAALSDGALELLRPANPKVLALLRRHADQTVLVVANLSRYAQVAELDLAEFQRHVPVEMFGQVAFPPIGELPYMLTLTPHACFWLVLRPPESFAEGPAGRVGHSLQSGPPPAVLELDGPPERIFEESAWHLLEGVLPSFLATRRWFGGKAHTLRSAHIAEVVPTRMVVGGTEARIVLVDVDFVESAPQRYLIPLGLGSAEQVRWHGGLPADAIVAELRVRQESFPQMVVLYDVFGEEEFNHGVLATIGSRRTLTGLRGKLQARTSRVFRQMRGSPSERLPSKTLKAETSNSGAFYGDRFILKLFRRLDEGTNPELEIGSFLTDEVAFANVAPVAGAIEYQGKGGEKATVALLSGLVHNEGSAWEHALNSLSAFFERIGADSLITEPPEPEGEGGSLRGSAIVEPPGEAEQAAGTYLRSAELLGRRTAEMHRALATDTGNPDFTPEPFSRLYQRSLYQNFRNQMARALEFLEQRLADLPPESREGAQTVLGAKQAVDDRLRVLLEEPFEATRIRCHGDYHLGQVLFTGNDFVIIDFEGEPARPIGERRIKSSPLRDVAGMLRSLDYACHAAATDQFGAVVLPHNDRRRLDRWLQCWVGWVSAAYLRTYLAVAEHASFIPNRREHVWTLLDVYLLEKAFYELQYELNNRPTWAHIPLGGIVRLLSSK